MNPPTAAAEENNNSTDQAQHRSRERHPGSIIIVNPLHLQPQAILIVTIPPIAQIAPHNAKQDKVNDAGHSRDDKGQDSNKRRQQRSNHTRAQRKDKSDKVEGRGDGVEDHGLCERARGAHRVVRVELAKGLLGGEVGVARLATVGADEALDDAEGGVPEVAGALASVFHSSFSIMG